MSLLRPLILLTALSAACVSERDRPTGPGPIVPPTSVSVVIPADGRSVGADSLVHVVIQATGLIQAVEYEANWVSRSDTMVGERNVLETPQTEVQVGFEFRVPDIPTGTNVQVSGIAEDTEGERHRSEPIFLLVIDCDQFPVACGGGPSR